MAGPHRVVPVIMSGGSGTRLWPLSTEETPKQFHALGSDLTMIQATARRVAGHPEVAFTAPIIVCNRRHRAVVEQQLAEVGIEPLSIVLEPFGRSTAAVAAIASELVAAHEPGALALLLPADHVIVDEAAFRRAVAAGVEARDRIVTFGIAPTAPETGFGYIQQGEPLVEDVFAVARFAEKPKREVAEAYLAEGGYHWNGGIFLFDPKVMLQELEAHRPDILESASAALKGAERDGAVIALTDDLFAKVPSESIDVAVMEPTKLAAVAPCDAGWADVGSWSELWRLGPFDAQGNVARGGTVLIDAKDSLVMAHGGTTVGVIGLSEVVVVAANGAVIVLPKSRAQDVKKIVEAVRARSAAP